MRKLPAVEGWLGGLRHSRSSGAALNINGLGCNCGVVQASGDLQSWTNFITTNFPSGPIQFTDPQSPNLNQRFYRFIQPQPF